MQNRPSFIFVEQVTPWLQLYSLASTFQIFPCPLTASYQASHVAEGIWQFPKIGVPHWVESYFLRGYIRGPLFS